VKIVEIRKQVVAGLFFVIVWQTESGKKVEIKIHIQPWQEGAARFVRVDNAITMLP
jgi:hypothetical protein